MKNTFKLACAVAVLGFSASMASAQVRDAQSQTNTPGANTFVASSGHGDEYVAMKNGNMIFHLNGQDLSLAAPYPCADDTKVATDGTVTKKDGSTVKLREGDKVYSDGYIAQADNNNGGSYGNK